MPKGMIVIEHKDGRQYAVKPADFHKQYEPEGFKAVRYESGEPYEPKAKGKGKGDDGGDAA